MKKATAKKWPVGWAVGVDTDGEAVVLRVDTDARASHDPKEAVVVASFEDDDVIGFPNEDALVGIPAVVWLACQALHEARQ